MKVIFAEALSTEPVEDRQGNQLCSARVLSTDSDKYKIISSLFESKTISYFVKIGDALNHFLKNDNPLVFVTDWTDPTEMIGLRLESEGKVIDYPNLCFLAFYTDWNNIKNSGIEEIFAHEFSHLWLSLLGYDFKLSQSVKFHTCTAITDPFMAFSEGLAEQLEITTRDLGNYSKFENEFWDYAYNHNAWLCLRDSQLRYYGVINNRFIYHTAFPYQLDYDTYNQIHMDHITSSAFTPEKLKNGSQMMSSEGVISAIFYQMYKNDLFKNTFAADSLYMQFGVNKSELNPIMNLYIKILYAISKIDLKKITLMTDFICSYCEEFPDEKNELINIFTKITHFCTISLEAKKVFEKLYILGRRGNIDLFNEAVIATKRWKSDMMSKINNSEVSLDDALFDELWIGSDEYITPTPWEPDEKVKYRYNINTATEIDLLSIHGMTLEHAIELVKTRDAKGGFKSLDEFYNLMKIIIYGGKNGK